MSSTEFSIWWDDLLAALKPGTEIPHWSAQGQYQEESFKVVKVESNGVWIDISRPTLPSPNRPVIERHRLTLDELAMGRPGQLIPTNREHYLKRQLFLLTLAHWGEYCSLTISRKTMDVKIGGGSTYVISIVKWMQDHSK
jgi:hypothetical protein